MPSIGPMEILILLVIALLVFGSKRLPELGSGVGRGLHDFAKGLKGEAKPEREATAEAATSTRRIDG